jgi:hypothetical protein
MHPTGRKGAMRLSSITTVINQHSKSALLLMFVLLFLESFELPIPGETGLTRSNFERLAYTHRKEYARWIGEAKRDETRRRRIAPALELLRIKRKAAAYRRGRNARPDMTSGDIPEL